MKLGALLTFWICITTTVVSGFTLNAWTEPNKAVLGSNTFEIICSYELNSGEFVSSLTLLRKRSGENAFVRIVSYPAPIQGLNASYINDGNVLEDRTTLVSPTTDSNVAKVIFSSIQCDDKAEYMWEVAYYSNQPLVANRTVTFDIQANNRFEDTKQLSYTPNIDISENDEVVFTCNGDVGNEPTGQLLWYYYLNNDTDRAINVSQQSVPENPQFVESTCSNTRKSRLSLTMTKEFNNIIVRCTVAQFTRDQFGDGHIQTSNIPVYYSPRITRISKDPDSSSYLEGLESLTLTCTADANPVSQYHWVGPDNSTVVGPTMTLTNLTVNDTGSYKCVATNQFLGLNHSTDQIVTLIISPVPPSTTTPTPSSSDGTEGTETPGSPASTTDDDNKTTTIIIVVVVVAVVIIIVIVIVLVYIKTRKKPKEIEEPPEKPRNNQGLFYGNRPDLVSADHNAKNNMGSSGGLNSSFNNSFDSSSDTKPRNDDGLLYIDLQFENKPGSRRPIQLVDNMGGGNTPYADIVNPRV